MENSIKLITLAATFTLSFALTSTVQAETQTCTTTTNTQTVCATGAAAAPVTTITPVTVMHGEPVWTSQWDGDKDENEEQAAAELLSKPVPVAEVPLKPLQTAKPHEVVSTNNLEAPHKTLSGSDLTFWNSYCRGQNPKDVYEWRYGKCNGLDSDFRK